MDETLAETAEAVTELGATYTFPASALPAAIHAIEKANRKLARHGVDGEFTYTVSEPREVPMSREFFDPTVGDDPNAPDHLGAYVTVLTGVTRVVVDFTLDTPVLCFSGWEFVATLVHEEAGVIARTVPGRSLQGWTPNQDTACDHCHTKRRRRDTYVVRHVGSAEEPATGEVKQIGSNCLEAFLGVRPSGLWMLGMEPLADTAFDEEPERRGGGGGMADYRVPVREVIRHALAASGLGTRYTPRSAVQYGNGLATADVARMLMFDRMDRKQREKFAEEINAVGAVPEETIDAVIAAGRAIEGDSDYAANMHVALASENVDTRTMGLVVSAIGAWNRAEQRLVERAARAEIAKGYLAGVGEKITDIAATITNVHRTKGDWGWTTILTMIATDTGHQLKWFTSSFQAYDKGDKVVVTQATVKKHDTWNDTDSTVIARAKLVDVEPDETAADTPDDQGELR